MSTNATGRERRFLRGMQDATSEFENIRDKAEAIGRTQDIILGGLLGKERALSCLGGAVRKSRT